MASSPRLPRFLISFLFSLLLTSHFCLCNHHQLILLPLKTQSPPTVTLSVGTPPQPATMLVDTGSELAWLRSNFSSSRSSSYSPIPFSSPDCRNRTHTLPVLPYRDPKTGLCHVLISYADASSANGTLAADIFHLGDAAADMRTLFGCMDVESSSNPEDGKTAGILAMNRGGLSFAAQTNLTGFSYCIAGDGAPGVLLLGAARFRWLPARTYTPMVQKSTPLPGFDLAAYTVALLGIKVNRTSLLLDPAVLRPDHTGAGQTTVDSGTQFTYLLGAAYKVLKTEFLRQTKGRLTPLDDGEGFAFQGTMDCCFRPPLGRLPELPGVTLEFPGAELRVAGWKKLMYRVRGAGPNQTDPAYCLTVGNSDLLGIQQYVIGYHHQRNMWMEFDLRNSRIGITEAWCGDAGQRLGIRP